MPVQAQNVAEQLATVAIVFNYENHSVAHPRGQRDTNLVLSASDCTSIVPPCATTISLTMNSPSPNPSVPVVRLNGSNRVLSASCAIGTPRFITSKITASPSAFTLTRTGGSPCCTALTIKFETACA